MSLIRDNETIHADDGDYYGGWIPHELRTKDERDIHDALVGAMPEFKVIYAAGQGEPEAKEADLTYYTRLANGGKHFPTLCQRDVGSCEGHSLAGVCWAVQAIDAYKFGDLESVVMPYEPYCYAQSRVCAGISGRGDGSTGSGSAEAAKKFGILDSRLPGLPKFEVSESEVDFLQTYDRKWGMRGAPGEWIEHGVKHPVVTTALCRGVKQAIEALKSGFPIQTSSSWGGLMECPIVGGVRLNKRSRDWGHAMHVLRWREHPDLGNIFCFVNSWAPGCHGEPPDDSPRCSFWMLEKDFACVVGEGDSYIFSGAEGFPAAPANWYMGA